MKTQEDLQTVAHAVAKAAPDLDEEKRRVALSIYAQLAEGSPAGASEIAAQAGAPTERVQEMLNSTPGIFFDDDGRVVGFWGLALEKLSPTHRVSTGSKELFAWCAWDTLFLPGVLDQTLEVESTCPVTAESISLVVSPSGMKEISHPDATVSFLIPDQDFDADIVTSFCHFVHFFASEEAADSWTAQHPGTFSLPLRDAFELGRMVNELNFGSTLPGNR